MKLTLRALIPSALVLAALGCSSPTRSIDPNPTPTSAAPTATTAPPGLFCAKGTLTASCGGGAQTLRPELDAAIDRVIASHPEIFNLKESIGRGAYHVLDHPAYVAALLTELNAAGLCAEVNDRDLVYVKIKSSNDYSERYALTTSRDFIRRDAGAFVETCRPAIFPVDNADYIDRVRVGFFNFDCLDRTPPAYTDFILPMTCLGYITATPKDKNLVSVPRTIHGAKIDWELVDGAGVVRLYPDPKEEFNMFADPIRPGHFMVCATVLGKKGCMTADVVP